MTKITLSRIQTMDKDELKLLKLMYVAKTLYNSDSAEDILNSINNNVFSATKNRSFHNVKGISLEFVKSIFNVFEARAFYIIYNLPK